MAIRNYRNGEFSLTERDGRAYAAYPDRSTGKRHRVDLKVSIKDEAAARRALDSFAEKMRTMYALQADKTVGELWYLWMEDRRKDGLSDHIYKHNWTAMRPILGHLKATAMTRDTTRDYARHRFEVGIKPWTVHTELSRLRACFKWSFDEGLIGKLPKVWVPSPGKSRKRVLSFDEAKRLLAAAYRGQMHVWLFVVLLFATGARHTAILDLTWDRIDFERGTINYEDDVEFDPMSRAYRKGRAVVPMNALAREALKRAMEYRTCEYVIEYGGGRVKDAGQGFQAAVKRAGLWNPDDRITPHTIRHTVLTWLDEAQVEDKRRAQLAGHANEETTKKVYTHSDASVLRPAVEILDLAFSPLPKVTENGDLSEPKDPRNSASLSNLDNEGEMT